MSAETDGCFPKHSREACQVAVTPAKSVGGEPARCTTQPSSLGSETPGPSDKSVLRLFFFLLGHFSHPFHSSFSWEMNFLWSYLGEE